MPENPFHKINKISETSHEANVGVIKELLGEEEGSAYAALWKKTPIDNNAALTPAERESIDSEKHWDRDGYIDWAVSIGEDAKWIDRDFVFKDDGTVECRFISIDNNTLLTELPPNLTTIRDFLSLKKCTSLKTLPANLRVGGFIDLTGFVSLLNIPQGLPSSSSSLNLNGCVALMELPENLDVDDLSLEGCTALALLPKNLTIRHTLELYDCTTLVGIGEGLKVEGLTNITNCPALKDLPDGLTFGNRVQINGCSALIKIPKDFHVKGSLEIMSCPNLTLMSEGIQVKNSLYISNTPMLTTLPTNLTAKLLDVPQHLASEAKKLQKAGKVKEIHVSVYA